MSKMMRLSFILICFCICIPPISNAAGTAEGVSISGLPVAVQEVVKREFAGVQITEVDDDEYDGIKVYEIEAETADGKELMIKVGPDGTLYQKEVEIGLEDVPKPVLAVFRKELGDADDDVDEVKRISKQGRVQYNIEAEISGKGVELKIAADGTLLEKDVDDDDGPDEGDEGVLAGILYDSMDFTNPRSGLDVLRSLDMRWGPERGKGWSARWFGGINGPYFGDVTFTAETNGKVRLTIAGYVVIDTITKDGPLTAVTRMAKDGGDWIQIEFVATESPSYLRIYWQWPGQPKAIVFNDELDYDEDDIPGYGVEDQRRDDEDDKVSPLLP
ncbi:MAG: PepSY-like domain-containing protein, partial [Planctomycetota bacterium]